MDFIQVLLLGISFAVPFGATSALLIDFSLKSKKDAFQYIFGIITTNILIIAVVLFGLGTLNKLVDKRVLLLAGSLFLFYTVYKNLSKKKSKNTKVTNPFVSGLIISFLSFFDWVWWSTVFTSLALGANVTESIVSAAVILTIRFLWLSSIALIIIKTGKTMDENLKSRINVIASVLIFLFAIYFLYLVISKNS